MRIISGKFKGKRFTPPQNLDARPTTDQAKEALFNILSSNYYDSYEELSVLDLFAGTGNISYEFASRGCSHITAVDINGRHTRYIERMAESMNLGKELLVIQSDVAKYLRGKSLKTFDFIFADPPYDMPDFDKVPEWVFASGKLSPTGLLVIEHSKAHDFSGYKYFTEQRHYGKVNFSFFDPELAEKQE